MLDKDWREEFPQNDLELSTWDKYTLSPIPQNLLRGNPHNKLHVLNNEFLFTTIKSDRCIERFFSPPPIPLLKIEIYIHSLEPL